MRIAVVGAGDIGGALARTFAAARHEVTLAGNRRADELVTALGSTAHVAPLTDAVPGTDVVVLAVPFGAALDVVRRAGIERQIVVDATNYSPHRDGHGLVSPGATSSEILGTFVPAATVVKAFNTLWSVYLRTERRPPGPGRRVLLMAGDAPEAKTVVAGLIDAVGFDAVDAGSLAGGGRFLQPGSPLYNRLLTGEQARRALAGLG